MVTCLSLCCRTAVSHAIFFLMPLCVMAGLVLYTRFISRCIDTVSVQACITNSPWFFFWYLTDWSFWCPNDSKWFCNASSNPSSSFCLRDFNPIGFPPSFVELSRKKPKPGQHWLYICWLNCDIESPC